MYAILPYMRPYYVSGVVVGAYDRDGCRINNMHGHVISIISWK